MDSKNEDKLRKLFPYHEGLTTYLRQLTNNEIKELK